MAGGFTGDDGCFETIQSTLLNGIEFARSQITVGTSNTHCDECSNAIPLARQQAVSGCKYCIECQAEHDKSIKSYYNRRGSKDSQLR